MKFCQPHWDKLRHAIQARGLGDFISGDTKEVIARVKKELEGGIPTKRDFDPLMAAHWMIVNNVMETIRDIGGNPFTLMGGDDDTPEQSCPICHLNWLSAEHDKVCVNPDCKKPKGLIFDDWIERAADSAKELMETLPEGAQP